MPLSVDNVIHENSGTTASGTSHVVSLAGTDATTAGNTVLIFFGEAAGLTLTPPSGFTNVKTNNTHFVMVKSDVAAAETSWTFTTPSAATTAWYVVEMSNVDLVEPLDASAASSGSAGNGGTLSTGTSGLNAGLSTIEFAMFGGTTATSPSWSGYTNGFAEVADVAGTNTGLAVARKFTDGSTGTFESTATLSTSSGALLTYATMVVFRAADTPIVAPLAHFVGMEWGTHGGSNSHNGPTNMFGGQVTPVGGTWGTNYLVQAASARNSNYGLRIVHSASWNYVPIGNFTTKSMAFGLDVRVVSATGTVIVLDTSTAQLLYDSSANKFGVRCGSTGTVSWQSGTTALNTWVWIDLRVKSGTSTFHADWRIETGTGVYTDQAAAELTGQSPLNMSFIIVGNSGTAQTMTADYDNIVISTYYVAYPLGPHQVKLLTVDPAGTPTISGTTTNFSTFASNGTLTAWNATTARGAVDEVPPTISAAADGVTQTASAASDYMEFPMQTYTLGPTEFVNGVRVLAAIGSGTGAGSGDFAIRGWDGVAETALASVSQVAPGSGTAITSTFPRWLCGNWLSTNGWTQAELDNAAVRAGFSGDATPDMWMHAVYLEVAIGKTKTQQLFGSMASIEQDPTRLGAVSVTMAAPAAGADSSLYYEQGGSPTTVPVTGGTTTTQQLNSEFAADTNYVAAYWPPEGVPDA